MLHAVAGAEISFLCSWGSSQCSPPSRFPSVGISQKMIVVPSRACNLESTSEEKLLNNFGFIFKVQY